MNTPTQNCPCGSTQPQENCCGRYLNGTAIAPTADALMRSRYSAYVLENEAYLRATWDPRTLPAERLVHAEPTKWLGLEVRKHIQDGDKATVEFVARYKIAGKAHRLHEVSRFLREDGMWFYVDGTFPHK